MTPLKRASPPTPRRSDEQMAAVGGAAPSAHHHPRHRPHRRVHHPDRDRPRHRGVRLQGTLRRIWAGLCPGNNESGGKRRNARTRMGSKTLRATLVECAHGAARTKGCQFEAHPPRACRPARLQARHRRRRTQDAPHHLCGAEERQALLRPHRRLRGADGQAQRPDRWIRMLRRYGYIEPVDAELKAA